MPKGDIPEYNSGEKVSLKRLYKMFRGARSHGLVSVEFLAGLNLFLGRKNIIFEKFS